jgi:hypothetical protein
LALKANLLAVSGSEGTFLRAEESTVTQKAESDDEKFAHFRCPDRLRIAVTTYLERCAFVPGPPGFALFRADAVSLAFSCFAFAAAAAFAVSLVTH